MKNPTEPQLIDVDSPLHHRLQEMPVDKMKELIRLRTRRGGERTAPSNQQPLGSEKQPMEAVPLADDLARQPLVRGHRRYPVGGQIDTVPAGESGAWVRNTPEVSKPRWRHLVTTMIVRLKGF